MVSRELIVAALCTGLLLAHRLAAPSPQRVAIRTQDSVEAEALAVDTWSEARGPGLPVDIVVMSDELDRLGAPYEVLDPDIDATADVERTRLQASAMTADWFGEFRDYGAISGHLSQLAALAPARVALQSIGTSLEGRPLWALKIGHGPSPMLINGTQHAREWIAAMTATCVADRLVRDYDRDPAIKDFVDRTTLWIVPVANPDGYQYSWSDKRYWRKNRRNGVGVDLNRNFSVAWGGDGSSKNERSETFRGPHAFSEPESTALRDLSLREHVAKHIDFHAYGQLVLYPWNHTKTPAKDRDRFAGIGDRIASAIFAQHQQRYALMPGVQLYAAAGTMTDWEYGEVGALSYTIELRPKGGSGFVLPPSEIRPTCDEGLAAVLALGKP